MTEESADPRPLPDDFVNYLPWACNQLQLAAVIMITSTQQNEYVNLALTDRSKKPKSRLKLTQSKHETASDSDKETASYIAQSQTDLKCIKIITVHDAYNNLVEIKFGKNKQIPRLLLKIIGLIIHFYFNLSKLVINGGMDKYTIYEINKIVKVSNITEMCLDCSYVKEGNYSILLETENAIRHLSLSKCKINDEVIEDISQKLIYPLPASKTLMILNLSTNRITDVGARHLAEALRSNRKLTYLNLADNSITDDGASDILDTLMQFSLGNEELLAVRSRYMMYLKEKSAVTERMVRELKTGDFDKKSVRRKTFRPASATSGKKSKLDKEPSLKSLVDSYGKSIISMEAAYFDKAVVMAENILGEFDDPFCSFNTEVANGIVYCTGNNILLHLNLAYNNLTYLTLKKVLNVLMFQKLLDRKPRGLLNLSIEGNYLPTSCKELKQINDIIDTGLLAHNRRLSSSKKRGPTRNISR